MLKPSCKSCTRRACTTIPGGLAAGNYCEHHWQDAYDSASCPPPACCYQIGPSSDWCSAPSTVSIKRPKASEGEAEYPLCGKHAKNFNHGVWTHTNLKGVAMKVCYAAKCDGKAITTVQDFGYCTAHWQMATINAYLPARCCVDFATGGCKKAATDVGIRKTDSSVWPFCVKHAIAWSTKTSLWTVQPLLEVTKGGTPSVTTATAKPRQGRKIIHQLPEDLPSLPSVGARQAADAFAVSVGEEPANVKVIDPHWRDLLRSCALVEIHCTAWRAETTLTLADLGIEPHDDEERRALGTVLQLGRRLLLPKRIVDERQRIENKFRAILWRRHSLPSHWGYLVPQQRYADWKFEAVAIRDEYLAFAQDTADRWEALMLEVEADYIVLGRQNYRRMVAAGRQPQQGEASWVSDFVKRCMSKCATKEHWLAQAKMWWDVSYVPLLSMLAKDEAEAAHEAAVVRAKTEMERDVLAGAAKQFEEGLLTFIADVRGALADKVFNAMADVLEALDKNAGEFRFPRNSTKQLRNLVEAVEGLKFWPDEALDAQMSAIKAMLDVPGERRAEDKISTALTRIGAETRALLNELGRAPERQTRSIGIPDEPKPLEEFVRASRAARPLSEFDFESDIKPTRQSRRKVSAGV